MDDYYKKQKEDLKRFRDDTKNHKMQIIKDEDLYRHIRMKNPKQLAYYFDIVTYPGHIVISGDMRTYAFSRTEDMFEFHRLDWDRNKVTIDYRYWMEKCETFSKTSGLRVYDHEAFIDAAKNCFRSTMQGVKGYRSLYKKFVKEILIDKYLSSSDAIVAVMEWRYLDDDFNEISPIEDFWEYGPFEKPSLHFKWVCWAIADTIRQYDEYKLKSD